MNPSQSESREEPMSLEKNDDIETRAPSGRLDSASQRVSMASSQRNSTMENTKPSGSTLTERPALRVQRSSPAIVSSTTGLSPSSTNTNTHSSYLHENESNSNFKTTATTPPTTTRIEKEKSLEQSQNQSAASTNVQSTNEIKQLLSDSDWTSRILGLEATNSRFKKWMITSNSDSTHPAALEELLDITIKCLNDSHQKISSQAYITIETLTTSQNSLIASKLGVLLPILFNRLNDRKAAIKTQASEMLDNLRKYHDPCALFGILSPHIPELPERTLISVVQFLITIAPLCGVYFYQAQNTGSFLNRMAIVLSSNSGRRPSSALILNGERLLELVYKAAPEVLILLLFSFFFRFDFDFDYLVFRLYWVKLQLYHFKIKLN